MRMLVCACAVCWLMIASRYTTLKTNFLQLSKESKAEAARNEELGLEVLHLANMKVVLMKEKDAYVPCGLSCVSGSLICFVVRCDAVCRVLMCDVVGWGAM